MEANGHQGTGAAVRVRAAALAALSMLLVAAVAAPSAEAHQTAGRTTVYLDGGVVKGTRDNHFAVRRTLVPGCHKVRVVQKQGGSVVSFSEQRECVERSSALEVEVDDFDVRITTKTAQTKTVGYENPMAR